MSKHFVYKFYDKDGLILYVGCSPTLLTRIIGHQSSSKWFVKVDTIKIEVFPNKKMLEKRNGN